MAELDSKYVAGRPGRVPLSRFRRAWHNFVTLNGHTDPDHPEYRRVYLMNVLLLVSTGICAFFFTFHLITADRFNALAGVNGFGVVAAGGLMIDLRRFHRVERTATLINLFALFGLAFFLAVEYRNDAAAIWAALYYPFAFFLKGVRSGVRYAVAYTLLVVLIVGVDVAVVDPVSAEAALTSVLNVLVGTLSFFAFLYYYEVTREEAADRLLAARERLTQLSHTDELTGLYNRRHFESVFPGEIKRAHRERRHFGLLMLDVDFFKAYNDHYGHPAGDDVLKQIAEVMRRCMRRTGDLVFRLGGEEFGALLMVESPEDAEAIAEAIREDVEGLALPSEGTHQGIVTVSIGVRLVDDDVPLADRHAARLMAEADGALYDAKRQGRNRVVRFGASEAARAQGLG
ncbi:diguanylate cyclase [Ectothiorhodospiraceae bacterium WFHF3C12]|nr:diguanylate cyclase [Ectothiorhodospiraceae bacterium WFHF3C12]